MPYQCQNANCKKVFQHTAKLIENNPVPNDPLGNVTTIESSVCPHCQSKAYSEVVEDKQGAINLADVTSLKDIAPNDFDTYQAQGYVLFEKWQKNLFVVKLKPKVVEVAPKDASTGTQSSAQPDVLGDTIKAGIADAKAKETQA